METARAICTPRGTLIFLFFQTITCIGFHYPRITKQRFTMQQHVFYSIQSTATETKNKDKIAA
jgi:hypothetical protein